MSERVRIAIGGALGRMGRAVAAVLEAEPRAVLAARFDREAGEGLVGRDAALAAAQVVIDFTSPEATVALAETAAVRGGPPLVLGATGLDPAQEAAVARAAARVAILRSGNFSLGLNLLLGLVRRAARALPAEDWDIEVFEAHHRRKLDAPSGAARMLGEAAARARGVALDSVVEVARHGPNAARAPGAIGISVMRAGGIVGEHSVAFAAEDEILTLSHSARDRSLFARGAVAGALWLTGRAPGLYDMQDVLGLDR